MEFTINSDGWTSLAARAYSPNQDDRPAGSVIHLLVIHAISLPPREFGGGGIVDLFLNRLDPDTHPYYREIAHLKVSAHFLIRRDGSAIQFVSTLRRAWHAGTSIWNGQERCNDFSVGIELEGCDDLPFEPVQYSALNGLIKILRASYPIDAIVGHSDIAPGRKTDPGPHFDWWRIEGNDLTDNRILLRLN